MAASVGLQAVAVVSVVRKSWSYLHKVAPNTSSGLTRQWFRSMCDVPEAPSQFSQTMKVTIMNKEYTSGLLIDAYSPFGFKLNTGMRVLGPCAIFPKSIFHWNIKDAVDITSDSLELFTLLEPKLDILIVGKGDPDSKIDFGIIQYLKQHKINIEILNTDQACATFNFLNAEGRYVAAALLPPTYIQNYFDDSIDLQLQLDYRELDTLDTGFNEIPKDGQDMDRLIPPHMKTLEEASQAGFQQFKSSILQGQKMKDKMFPKGKHGEPTSEQD